MTETPTIPLPVPLPEGATICKSGNYLQVGNAHTYPIASNRGRMPYHRYVLYEKLGKPFATRCQWCGYLLPWRSSLSPVQCHIIVADHLDGITSNNEPDNLVPSCDWCNRNRLWAQRHPDFWANWRKWMADVPPAVRPNLPQIARDFGIDALEYYHAGDSSQNFPPCFHSDSNRKIASSSGLSST